MMTRTWNNKLGYPVLFGLIAVMLFFTQYACKATGKPAPLPAAHQVERSSHNALLYVDRYDNKQLLKINNEQENKQFASFLVGFYDSVLRDKELESRKVYYQYRMTDDWSAIINGDSLKPVFYQPVTTLDSKKNEGVIVFELPGVKQPDTLVYQDSDGQWPLQIIVLKDLK